MPPPLRPRRRRRRPWRLRRGAARADSARLRVSRKARNRRWHALNGNPIGGKIPSPKAGPGGDASDGSLSEPLLATGERDAEQAEAEAEAAVAAADGFGKQAESAFGGLASQKTADKLPSVMPMLSIMPLNVEDAGVVDTEGESSPDEREETAGSESANTRADTRASRKRGATSVAGKRIAMKHARGHSNWGASVADDEARRAALEAAQAAQQEPELTEEERAELEAAERVLRRDGKLKVAGLLLLFTMSMVIWLEEHFVVHVLHLAHIDHHRAHPGLGLYIVGCLSGIMCYSVLMVIPSTFYVVVASFVFSFAAFPVCFAAQVAGMGINFHWGRFLRGRRSEFAASYHWMPNYALEIHAFREALAEHPVTLSFFMSFCPIPMPMYFFLVGRLTDLPRWIDFLIGATAQQWLYNTPLILLAALEPNEAGALDDAMEIWVQPVHIVLMVVTGIGCCIFVALAWHYTKQELAKYSSDAEGLQEQMIAYQEEEETSESDDEEYMQQAMFDDDDEYDDDDPTRSAFESRVPESPDLSNPLGRFFSSVKNLRLSKKGSAKDVGRNATRTQTRCDTTQNESVVAPLHLSIQNLSVMQLNVQALTTPAPQDGNTTTESGDAKDMKDTAQRGATTSSSNNKVNTSTSSKKDKDSTTGRGAKKEKDATKGRGAKKGVDSTGGRGAAPEEKKEKKKKKLADKKKNFFSGKKDEDGEKKDEKGAKQAAEEPAKQRVDKGQKAQQDACVAAAAALVFSAPAPVAEEAGNDWGLFWWKIEDGSI